MWRLVAAGTLAACASGARAACAEGEEGWGCARLDLTVGEVVGNVWRHGEEFLTLPYATAERFSPPVVRDTLPRHPFDATNILGFGQDACLQGPYVKNATSYGVEDCLILNLYRPRAEARGSNPGALPIMVWVFGGDNTASEIIPYNATRLAGQHHAIVAVVSYRLGLFGFSAFEDDERTEHGTGNNGLHDVLAAARWLKREARRFGGDPDRMIVFGESSGATDAQILTLAPAASGLFRGSISESGGLYANSLEDAVHSTREVARAVGCRGTAAEIKQCMRGKRGSELVGPASNSMWGPTVDGKFLPAQPMVLLSDGALNPGVSVLWGGNTNDSATAYLLYEYVTEREYVESLNQTIQGFGPLGVGVGVGVGGSTAAASGRLGRGALRRRRHHDRVLRGSRTRRAVEPGAARDLLNRALAIYPPRKARFPRDPEANNAELEGWFQSDQFLCGVRREVAAASKAVSKGGQAFMYRFDWLFQSSKECIADSNYHDPRSGSNHADEMTFVYGQPIFDNQDPPGYSYTNCSDPASKYYDEVNCRGCRFNPAEAAFSLAVGAFWSAFARNGAPGGGWAAFTPTAPLNMVLHPDAVTMEINVSRTSACALWDDVELATRA